MRRIGAILCLAVLPAACDHEARFFSSRRDVADHRAERGDRTFVNYCAPCHGMDGAGKGRYFASSLEPKPPDFGDLDFQAEHDDDRLRRAIRDGSRAVGGSNLCPPWGRTLPPERIEDLIHAIRSQGRHPGIGLRKIPLSAAKGAVEEPR